MSKPSGLGKGLGALLPNRAPISDDRMLNHDYRSNSHEEKESGGYNNEIEISKIKPNPNQPRKAFDQAKLLELAQSIKEHGVIQPITVRALGDEYQLIAGERRFRASQLAGLKSIPAFILKVANDADAIEKALVENVQRENLNPIEAALCYKHLIEEYSLTQEDVAKKISKDRATVANILRLLKLPIIVQDLVKQEILSMGHARAILAASSEENQILAAKFIAENAYSVRSAEALIRDLEAKKVEIVIADGKAKLVKVSKPKEEKKNESIDDETLHVLADFENRLRTKFATQVKINAKTKDSGVIEIQFYSGDEFERILELLGAKEEN